MSINELAVISCKRGFGFGIVILFTPVLDSQMSLLLPQEILYRKLLLD